MYSCRKRRRKDHRDEGNEFELTQIKETGQEIRFGKVKTILFVINFSNYSCYITVKAII